jgi:mevalonate kinase
LKPFPAKILLFGEYTVIKGSMALAIPFEKLNGQLIIPDDPSEKDIQSNQFLRQLLEFLKSSDSFSWLDISGFEKDIETLAFQTNIPIGYGAGSSGALVASVYYRYKTSEANSHKETQQRLAAMECCFHGQSSGLDPLVSYLRQAVVTLPNGHIELIAKPHTPYLYLMDTGKSRSTAPLVGLFKKKLESNDFQLSIELLSNLNKLAIDQLRKAKYEDLFDTFLKISAIQWARFREMIPKSHQEIWKESLTDKEFAIKLCGAGGGGFLLVMAKPQDKHPEFLPSDLLSLS